MLYGQKDTPMTQSLMCFGFECGDGWCDIIRRLSEKLERWNEENSNDDRPPIEACQVKEKFGCYDDKTEILTRDGWKFFKNITSHDAVASLIDGNRLEYVIPSDVISYYYEGEMYKLKTRSVDLLVTPNHRLYVAKGTTYNGKHKPCLKTEGVFELSTPDKFFGKNKAFKKDAVWSGIQIDTFVLNAYVYHASYKEIDRIYTKQEKSFPMKDWLKFLGFYTAEGCSDKKRGSVAIACNNVDGGKEALMTESLISALDYKIKAKMLDKSARVYGIYNRQLCNFLLDNCGHLAHNKKVPNFVKELSSDLIRHFLKYLFIGDGHRSKCALTLTTTSKKLADDVQELILKVGDSSRIYSARPARSSALVIGKHETYTVNWHKNEKRHNTQNKGLSKGSIEKYIDYAGMVYCVTVPSNIIFVRRNGIPVWCGNSLRFYVDNCPSEMQDAISEAEHESETTCDRCGKPGKSRGGGWIRTLCDDCDAEHKKAKAEREAEYERLRKEQGAAK